MNKIFNIIAIIALVVALLAFVKPVKIVEEILGGSVHNTFETFDAGIGIDGKTKITNDGTDITIGSVYAFGESASTSITAEMLCEGQDSRAYNFFTIEPFEYGNDEYSGASISFSQDEVFTAINDCIEDQGDKIRFTIDNTASTATAFLDLTTTGLVNQYVTASYDGYSTNTGRKDFHGGYLIDVEIENVDGSSLSWTFFPRQVSVSYQPQ